MRRRQIRPKILQLLHDIEDRLAIPARLTSSKSMTASLSNSTSQAFGCLAIRQP
jgi:hypothetical protein